MFDNINCEVPLPVAGFEGREFQTKDTPNQFLDNYKIDSESQLWVEEYDIVDRSDPTAEGISRIFGRLSRENKRWKMVNDFTGNIKFYDFENPAESKNLKSFSADFIDGKLNGDIKEVSR